MITITITIYGTSQPSAHQLTIPDGSCLGEALSSLSLPAGHLILLQNGVHASCDTPLSDGDRIAIFPPLAGG